MDIATLLKFVHVVLAILWIGGGMCLILLGGFIGRNAPPAAVMALVRHVALYAPRVFVPSSVLVLASGLALVLVAGWAWEAWVVLGLAGVAFTALFGARVLGPLADRAVAQADAGDEVLGARTGRQLLRLARIDYVVQFAIVFLMVAKPGWSDAGVLAAVGVAVAGGVALFALRAPAAA